MAAVKTNERPGTRAQVKFVRVSAYKAREVLNLIRGKSYAQASEILTFSERRVSDTILKCLDSAAANAENNDHIPAEELYVAACYADEGPTLKRWRPRARGRATRIRKRTCHITIIVARYTPDQLDEMLGAIGDAPGLVLDFRANTGGGTDHDAVFSRFLKEGESFGGREGLGEGEHFTGPIVAIVDAGVASAAETVSGMLKESGRAYVIGPSHTAGMSGSKETITVPSGLLTVRITVRSYHAGDSSGPAIEGHGVAPHELVEFAPKLMDEGVDPFIARAEELLTEGLPAKVVRYR